MNVNPDIAVPTPSLPSSRDGLTTELATAQRKVANLEQALTTSRVIGTAIGVLVERHKVTPEAAFDMLVASSQNSNRKLRDVADSFVYSGQLP